MKFSWTAPWGKIFGEPKPDAYPRHPDWPWLKLQATVKNGVTYLTNRGAFATWFGGASDPHDSGETASGVVTRAKGVMGCALPVPTTVRGVEFVHTKNSPIPRGLPWKTRVLVKRRDTGLSIVVPIIDRGPRQTAALDGDVIDLTPAVFGALGVPLDRRGVPTIGKLPIDFVIIVPHGTLLQ